MVTVVSFEAPGLGPLTTQLIDLVRANPSALWFFIAVGVIMCVLFLSREACAGL